MQSNTTVEDKKMPARRGKKKPFLNDDDNNNNSNNNNKHTSDTVSAVPMEEYHMNHSHTEPTLQEDHAATTPNPHVVVELLPGVYEPLRSAQETWCAIERDYFVPSTCLTCRSHIFCIEDSRFVLCPMCRVVSPLHALEQPPRERDHVAATPTRVVPSARDGSTLTTPTTPQVRGIGLGFTYEQLCEWQNDILRQRHGRGHRHGRRMSAVW